MQKIILLLVIIYLTSCDSKTSPKSTKSDTLLTGNLSVQDTVLTKSEPSNQNTANDLGTDEVLNDQLVIDAMKNFAWQWWQAKDGGNIEIDVNGITIYASDKNYSVLTSLGAVARGDESNGFKMLLNGQRHNPTVQEQYKAVRDKYKAAKFWELVCSSTKPECNSNLTDVSNNLVWQKKANNESYQNAQINFRNRNFGTAMYWLMWGQRHNPSIMETYRATFRDSKSDFIKLMQ